MKMEQTKNLIKNMTLDSKKYCPYCKKEKKPMVLNFGGIKKKVYPVCKCETEAYEKQKLEDEQKERMRRLENLFKQSRLGNRFKNSSFENFIVRQGTEDAYKIAKDYVKNFGIYREEGRNLLFVGIQGTGKTHLSAAITNALIKKMTSVVFIFVPELLQKIRSTYGAGAETEAQIMQGLADTDLLILDDIGAEKTTDWSTEKILSVINSRYSNNQPTVFTTNCSSEELIDRIGNRTFSRIMEVCTPVKLTCDDYRLRKF